MNFARRLATATCAVLVLAAPVACGKEQPSPSEPPEPQPSVSAPPSAEPTPSPSAVPTRPPTVTTPGPATTVLSARLAYQWRWPNDADRPGRVRHQQAVPPVPQLVRIGVGDHPRDLGERPYNRMSFTFTVGYPSYEFQFVDRLVGDASDMPIPLAGRGVLRVSFRQAQAHTADGTRSSIVSQPPARLGLTRMVGYASAGDFEGVVTYGIGIDWPIAQSNPQIAVRAYEVTTVNRSSQRLYVIAIDVDAT